MDEGRAVALLIDALEIDHELVGIVFGVCEDLGAEEAEDVIRDYIAGLVLEVGVVDAEVGVEPVDLASNELAWNEPLRKKW